MEKCSRCDRDILGKHDIIEDKNVCMKCLTVSEWCNINYPEEA